MAIINVNVDDDLKKLIQKFCIDHGKTVSAVTRDLFLKAMNDDNVFCEKLLNKEDGKNGSAAID